jgi:cell division protein FtsQ
MNNRFRKKGDTERNARRKRRGPHVLDVRVRPGARKLRRRLSPGHKRFLGIAAICGCVLLTGGGIRWAVKRYLLEAPEYTLQIIRYETDGKLAKEAVLRQAELEAGVNLLTVNLDAVRSRLLALPEIKSVSLQRDLPDKLTVSITERRPVAWLACKALHVEPRTSTYRDGSVRGLMIDDEGVILECQKLRPEYVKMPVVHVRDLSVSTPGQQVDREQIVRSLELIDLTNSLLVADSLLLTDIEIRNDFSLVGKFNSGAEVTFGLEEIERQVRDYQLINADTARSRRRIETVNLLVKRNIPVTFVEGGAALTPRMDRTDGGPATPEAYPVGEPEQAIDPEAVPVRPKVRRSAPVIRRAIPRDDLGDPQLRNILGAG